MGSDSGKAFGLGGWLAIGRIGPIRHIARIGRIGLSGLLAFGHQMRLGPAARKFHAPATTPANGDQATVQQLQLRIFEIILVPSQGLHDGLPAGDLADLEDLEKKVGFAHGAMKLDEAIIQGGRHQPTS